MNIVHINNVQINSSSILNKNKLIRGRPISQDAHSDKEFTSHTGFGGYDPMKIIQKTKENILEDALDFIAREGLHQVTIRSLAAHSEVSVGTLYNYFGDKETLLEDIMNFYWKDAIEAITSGTKRFGTISELADSLFLLLKKYSMEFHRDFIRTRDPGDSQQYMKRSMQQVFIALQVQVVLALNQLPYSEDRFGKKTDFANLVIDQVVNCLQRKENDLGSLKIMIKKLEG